MTENIYHIGNAFYQIFTRFLPIYNQYIEIDIYHFTSKKVSIKREKTFLLKIRKLLSFCKNHGKFGKLVKFSECIAKGSGKNLVNCSVKNFPTEMVL